MKKTLGLLGAFVLFLVAVFAALMVFPPVGLARKMLIGGTKHFTGLDLQINGPMSLKLFPSVKLDMQDVVLTNPTVTPVKPIVVARSAQVTSALSFSGDLDRIALSDAVVDLETDSQGRHSWQAAMPAQTRDAASTRRSRSFSVASIELAGTTVAYRNQQTGMTARLERTRSFIKNVSTDSVGEAVVEAGAVTYTEPASGTNVEVSELNAAASAVSATRIGELKTRGTTVKWRDARQPTGVEAAGLTLVARDLGFEGSGPLTVTSGTLTWRDPASGGTLNTSALEVNAKSLRGGRLDEVAFKSGTLSFAHPAAGSYAAGNASGTVRAAKPDGLDDLAFKSATLNVVHPTAGTFDAKNVNASAKAVTPQRIEGLGAELGEAGYGAATPTRSGTPVPATLVRLQQVGVAVPVLALGTPLEAAVSFAHNGERVSGLLKLPTPETLAVAPSIPANVSFKSARGDLDFDGRIETGGAATVVKGRAQANTGAVDALAGWLGVAVPATLKGSARVTGDVDAQGARIALTNSRMEHGANVVTGNVAIDTSGSRPRISGRLSADKLDVDAYIGSQPVAPKPSQQPRPQGSPRPQAQVIEPEVGLGDVFKEYVRAMIDAPPRRSGGIELPELTGEQLIAPAKRSRPAASAIKWSEEKIDLSGLRAVDLDVDWSINQLGVRGMQLNVPQLKTTLTGGLLTLDGRDLGTKDGKITGRADIDARDAVPAITASLTGQGVDIYALSAAVGMTPMIDGDASVVANVRSRGANQKQLVEQLSGTVTTEMPQGHVLGYDLGSLNLFTLPKLLFGARRFDPEARTPISALKADLKIDKGVVDDSTVSVGGPLLGVNAEGTIGLVEQRIDYRGRARISTLFNFAFRYFGDWARATFVPSLASARDRAGPGEASLAEVIAGADIKEDPELALMIGRLLQKEGANGVDPAMAAILRMVQQKALGNK